MIRYQMTTPHPMCERSLTLPGVFPSAESYVRLISCYLLEYSEDWLTERSYVRKEAIEATKARMAEAA